MKLADCVANSSVMKAVRRMVGVNEYRSKAFCKITGGTVAPYADPDRINFYFADADVWLDSPWPGERYLATANTLPAALRELADRIEAKDEWTGKFPSRSGSQPDS